MIVGPEWIILKLKVYCFLLFYVSIFHNLYEVIKKFRLRIKVQVAFCFVHEANICCYFYEFIFSVHAQIFLYDVALCKQLM